MMANLGRPKKRDEDKRLSPIGFRPTPKMRAQLDLEAQVNKRSLTKEIESRLERSFAIDEMQQAIREVLAE